MNEQLRMDVYADVKAFLDQKYPEAVGTIPQWPRHDTQLVSNEGVSQAVNAMFAAINKGDLTGTAEGIIVAITAITGMAVSLGIDLRPLWVAVHNSRMNGSDPADIGTLMSLQEPLDRPMKPAAVE